MKTFEQFFESYDIPSSHNSQLVVIYPFDGEIWTNTNTKIFNNISSKFPQSHYYVTIAVEPNSTDTTIKRNIIEACGVHPSQIIECNNPFEPYKILKQYNNEFDSVVLLLDDKHIPSQHHSKLQKFKKSLYLPYSQCIYYSQISTNTSNITSVELLIKYSNCATTIERKQFIESIFGKGVNFDMLDRILNLQINSNIFVEK